jgi:hypothetical protein
MNRVLRFAAAACIAVALSGCASIAQFASGVATSLSSSSPSQVSTYADATNAAILATKTVDLAVTTLTLSKATLTELQTLNDGLHAAWLQLKAANDAGQSLDYAAFNAALAAYQSYKTSQGISDATATS